MKNCKIIFVLFLISLPQHLLAFGLQFGLGFYSKELAGTDKTSAEEGTIQSNGNTGYGLNFEYGVTKNWRILFGYESNTYIFDNTKDVIEGDDRITLTRSSYGVKWIIFSRTALKFIYKSFEEVGFTVQPSGKAKLYNENLSTINFELNQILYLAARFYGGIKLGYDIPSSSKLIKNKQSTMYGVFFNFAITQSSRLQVDLDFIKSTKSDEFLNYLEDDSNLFLNYSVRF